MGTAFVQIIPLAFAAGVNVYATVAVLGLCSHYGLVALPSPPVVRSVGPAGVPNVGQ